METRVLGNKEELHYAPLALNERRFPIKLKNTFTTGFQIINLNPEYLIQVPPCTHEYFLITSMMSNVSQY